MIYTFSSLETNLLELAKMSLVLSFDFFSNFWDQHFYLDQLLLGTGDECNMQGSGALLKSSRAITET